jgi:aspartyl-tRNA(Asn)/glutamyl-tRNA(Gln) amidotransferase subunit A
MGLLNVSGEELRRRYRRREVSPVEVVEATLERLERRQPALNAFVTVFHDAAQAQAQEAEAAFREGGEVPPLAGVPVSLKDLFDVAGWPATAGSRILRRYVPARDAPAYTALRGAGAVVLGKTNMHEFAYGYPHPDFGQGNNPWNAGRSAGGSSSGSAASIGAGIGWGSLGSDTGGSVRLPAALCGIVGLKPTYEAIGREGMLPLSHSLDHVGLLTRSVDDCATLLRLLAPGLPAPEQAGRALRVGVLEELTGDPIEPAIGERFDAALRVLEGMGAGLEPVRIEGLTTIGERVMPILHAEAAHHHRRWYPARADDYASGTRDNLAIGVEVRATDYVAAMEERARFRRRVDDAFGAVDVLVSPTIGFTAPEREPEFAGSAALGYTLRSIPFDVSGHPAISLPMGLAGDLPTGLQLIAPRHRDTTLLAMAAAYEEAVGGFPAAPEQ